MLPITAVQRIAANVLIAFLFLAGAGCKPAPRSNPADAAPSTDGGSSHQPNAGDIKIFFQTLLPAVVKVADLKADPPVRMPNTSPDSNTWLFSVKLTLTPTEDLLALPSSEDVRATNDLASELNTLVSWHNAYVRSPYARIYGAFDVQTPKAPAPQLLVILQAKDKPLPPLYGKIAAEWQVDHWQFSNVDLELPPMGQLRASFTGPTMVKGSHEADVYVAAQQKAIADGKQKQAAIESRYANDLLAATKPGTVYRGQISHARGVVPCEVHFLDTPGADPQMTIFEIKVPQEPTYQYIYTAKLAPKVPLNVATDAVASPSIHLTAGSTGLDVPVGNLTVNYVRGTGKKTLFGSLPSVMLNGAGGMGTDQPFLLLDGHLKGVVSSFNGDFSLAVEQAR